VDLPGGAWKTTSVAIADMNNDGILGGSLYTQSLQIVDMNNDGSLDIIIGNLGKNGDIFSEQPVAHQCWQW
jgi:hypothetical protein